MATIREVLVTSLDFKAGREAKQFHEHTTFQALSREASFLSLLARALMALALD